MERCGGSRYQLSALIIMDSAFGQYVMQHFFAMQRRLVVPTSLDFQDTTTLLLAARSAVNYCPKAKSMNKRAAVFFCASNPARSINIIVDSQDLESCHSIRLGGSAADLLAASGFWD